MPTGRAEYGLSTEEIQDLANGYPTQGRPEKVSALEKYLARAVLEKCGHPPISIRLWSGEEFFGTTAEASVARICINDRMSFVRLLANAEHLTGDDFSEGRVDVEGDLVACLHYIFRGFGALTEVSTKARVLRWARRAQRNTPAGSRKNIHQHYDIGNSFYRLWLDEQHMQYTCAYYAREGMSLEEAQTAKLDHVARKVGLKAGDVVYEAGCGWGGLARHFAKKYGATVRAFNISAEQVAFARAEAERAGVADRVEYVLDDYRNISGKCDVFVSVGMLEHVGADYYPTLGRVIQRSLAPGGRGLIHSIGRNRAAPMNGWIEKRIFPGAYPPTLAEMMGIFEDNKLSVLDVENLRLHYRTTLQHWRERFDAHHDEIEMMFDERFVRMWRLYLAGSEASFLGGALQLFQVVFSHESNNAIPLTRAHLYGSA